MSLSKQYIDNVAFYILVRYIDIDALLSTVSTTIPIDDSPEITIEHLLATMPHDMTVTPIEDPLNTAFSGDDDHYEKYGLTLYSALDNEE